MLEAAAQDRRAAVTQLEAMVEEPTKLWKAAIDLASGVCCPAPCTAIHTSVRCVRLSKQGDHTFGFMLWTMAHR